MEPTILVVEDDEGHRVLIERALQGAGVDNDIVELGDGQRAIDYLLGEDAHLSSPLFVLLDLNLPRRSGFEVLEVLKSDRRTRRIPVVIFTTTDNPREMERCYDLGCNAYVTKPIEFERFGEAIRSIGQFLSVITIPAELAVCT